MRKSYRSPPRFAFWQSPAMSARWLVLPLLLLAGPAAATGDRSAHAASVRDDEVIVVDGLMDEAVWQRAEVIDAFVGQRPTEGFEPAGATRVRIAADRKALYVFFEARLDEDRRVRAYIAEREDINDDDQVAIQLDPFGDGRRAYIFWLNALGVQQDMLWTTFPNFAWDAVFTSRGRIVEGGYDVEVAIPFRSLRFPKHSDQPWKFVVKRKFPKRAEYVVWPPMRADDGPELLQYADLHGIEPARAGIGLELLPTVIVRTGQDRDPDTGELAWRKPAFRDTVDPGFGLKFQVTPSLTLDATLNPDFSQIEADPDLIDNNLRFALSLEERRPFFLEGSDLYNGFMLYSRSIVDPLYGVKFSGKAGRTSIAVLHAMDESPSASVVGERDTPGFMAEDVEGSLALVSHAETRVNLGRRSEFSIGYGDKEIVRGGEHIGQHHLLNVGGIVAIDAVSQFEAAAAYSVTGRVGGPLLHGPAWYAEYTRQSRLVGFGAGGAGSMPDFRTESGFFPQTGTADFWVFGHRRFDLRGPVRWIELGAVGSFELGELDQPAPVAQEAEIEGWIETQLPGVTDVRLELESWDATFQDKDFKGGTVGLGLESQPLEWFGAYLEGIVGDTIRFEDATQTLQRRVEAGVSLRGFRRLHLDLSGGVNFIGRDGDRIDRLLIYRAKAVVGITRALSVRVILQGRDAAALAGGATATASSRLDFSALVTLNPSPGTSIHIGFGERWAWSGKDQPETQSRNLFAKGSLLIRL